MCSLLFNFSLIESVLGCSSGNKYSICHQRPPESHPPLHRHGESWCRGDREGTRLWQPGISYGGGGHSQHNSHPISPISREARAIRSETLYGRSKKQQLANVESAWKGRCFSCKKHLFPTRLSWCCFPNIWVGQLKTQDVSFPCWFMWSEANMSYDL